VEEKEAEITFEFQCPTICELVFENYNKAKEFKIYDERETFLEYKEVLIEGTNKTIICFDRSGNVIVKVRL